MKKTFLILIALVAATGWLQAQTPEEEASIKAYMEFIAPNDHHAWLAQLAGEWNYKSSMWMDPSQPPLNGEGVTTKKMIMGGRYLEESHEGTSMGMPFEGLGHTAFDNAKQQYLTNWVDNMGTGFMQGAGQLEGDQLVTMTDYPNQAGGMDHIKTVTTVDGENKHTVIMYIVTPEGEDVKNMELIFTRK